MIDLLSTLAHAIGLRGDAASPTGSLHAKVKDVRDNMGTFAGDTTQTAIIRPTLADGIIQTAGNPAWTIGAWVEIVAASVLTGHSLIGIYLDRVDTGYYEAEIGEGGAGSETTIWRAYFRFESATAPGSPGVFIPVVPGRRVTANARIAARIASSPAANRMYVRLAFAPRPF